MTVNLREMIGEVVATATTVSTSSDAVTRTSGESSRAVAEIAGAMTEITSGAEAQLRMVSSATRSAAEMTQAVDASADAARQSAHAAQEARELAREGVAAVIQATTAMNAVRDSSRSASQAMSGLEGKSSQIGSIVQRITEIAEQTNLLALNAAIEAARAGEHGRGFAVVAQEIKALALRTATSTKQISEQIRGVQDESQRAMDAMASGVKAVDEGFQVALGAGDALGEIRTSARSAQKKTQSIARVIDEQKDASRRVVEAASTLAERAQQLAVKVNAESDHADQLRAGARGVSEAASRIDRLAREQLQTVQAVGAVVGKALGDALTLTRGHKDLRRQVDLLHHGASRIAGLESDMADRLAQVNEAAAQLREQMTRLAS